jgi:hypothetical protein
MFFCLPLFREDTFLAAMSISFNSSTLYKTYTWNILINQCSSYDHLENIFVKYIMVEMKRKYYCTAISQ